MFRKVHLSHFQDSWLLKHPNAIRDTDPSTIFFSHFANCTCLYLSIMRRSLNVALARGMALTQVLQCLFKLSCALSDDLPSFPVFLCFPFRSHILSHYMPCTTTLDSGLQGTLISLIQAFNQMERGQARKSPMAVRLFVKAAKVVAWVIPI